LPSAHFKVHVVDDDKAMACASNTVALYPYTHSDVQRDDVIEFQIPSIVEEQQLFTLEALKVRTTVDDCDTNTIFEYKNMRCFNE
jgi:hypothetical protein